MLAVSALGYSIEQAAHRAYDGVKVIRFNEAQYRRDIGLPKGLVSAKAKNPRPKRRP